MAAQRMMRGEPDSPKSIQSDASSDRSPKNFTELMKETKDRSSSLHFNPNDTDGPKVYTKQRKEKAFVKQFFLGDLLYGFQKGDEVQVEGDGPKGILVGPGANIGNVDVRWANDDPDAEPEVTEIDHRALVKVSRTKSVKK